MIRGCLLLVLAFSTTVFFAHGQEPKANPDDVKSVDAIVGALYDSISGPKGQERDWNRFRSLFLPQARLIPLRGEADGSATPQVLGVEEFVKLVRPDFQRDGFFEVEISHKVEWFGAIAHVFSTYESRKEKDGKPFARGINSIQLVKQGDRWYVVTILWETERPGFTIPAEYLPKKPECEVPR